jgi:hypothetical protein
VPSCRIRSYCGRVSQRRSKQPLVEHSQMNSKFPVDPSGKLIPLAVGGGGGWLNIGWYTGEQDVGDVAEFPPDARTSADWNWRRGSGRQGERGWAWRWGREWTKDFLGTALWAQGLRVDVPELVNEALWLTALAAARKGAFYHGTVPAATVLAALAEARLDVPLQLRDRVVPTDQIVTRLNELVGSGATEIRSSWPGPDVEDIRSGWAWGVYSPERQCERIETIYTAAMKAYDVVAAEWFPRLRKRMLIASTLPAKFDANFEPGERVGQSFPSLDWFLDPLEEGNESYASVRLVDGAAGRGWLTWQGDLLDRTRRLRQLRPDAAEWIYSIHTSGLTIVFQGAPLAAVVNDWLREDLRRLRLA